MGQNIQKPFNALRSSFASHEQIWEHMDLLNIQNAVQVSMSSLMLAAVLLMLLCVLILPFLQYLFSIGRGYETGILRALGMGKGRAWTELFTENLLLAFAALFISQCAALTFHMPFALSLLAVDAEARDMMSEAFEAFGNTGSVEYIGIFSYNWEAALFSFTLAAIITAITAGFCNMIISSNAPLKLIRNYK